MTRKPDGQTDLEALEWQAKTKRFREMSQERSRRMFTAGEEAEYKELLTWREEWFAKHGRSLD
jgi:hypothetical protein